MARRSTGRVAMQANTHRYGGTDRTMDTKNMLEYIPPITREEMKKAGSRAEREASDDDERWMFWQMLGLAPQVSFDEWSESRVSAT